LFEKLKEIIGSEALRGWIIIFITAFLATVAYHQWQVNPKLTVTDTVSQNYSNNTTKINLLFKNLGHRPTAVLYVYLMNKDGGIIRSIDERDGINLPIKIAPWSIEVIGFKVERHEKEQLSDFLITDIDDNRIRHRWKPR